jgi:hypothetical protein
MVVEHQTKKIFSKIATMTGRITQMQWENQLFIGIQNSVIHQWDEKEWIKIPIKTKRFTIMNEQLVYQENHGLHLFDLKSGTKSPIKDTKLKNNFQPIFTYWRDNKTIFIADDEDYFLNLIDHGRLYIIMSKNPTFYNQTSYIQGDITVLNPKESKSTFTESMIKIYPFLTQ